MWDIFFLRLKLNVLYPVFIYSRTLRLSKERTPFLLRSFEISPHPLKHPSIPPPCIQIPASAFPHYFFLLLFLSFFFLPKYVVPASFAKSFHPKCRDSESFGLPLTKQYKGCATRTDTASLCPNPEKLIPPPPRSIGLSGHRLVCNKMPALQRIILPFNGPVPPPRPTGYLDSSVEWKNVPLPRVKLEDLVTYTRRRVIKAISWELTGQSSSFVLKGPH